MTRTHPGSTLTEEEHIVRAALLGREYDPRDGTYSRMTAGETSFEDMIDADTLEPVPYLKSSERMEEWGSRISWDYIVEERRGRADRS